MQACTGTSIASSDHRTIREPVTAVIPNRDGARLLQRTLPPLLRELPAGLHEIVVVDDASEDESRSVLREQFPQVRVVALDKNVGFGEACRRGFLEASHSLVLLLNSDMEVTPGSVALLAAHFDDPEVFAAGPRYVSDATPASASAHVPCACRPQLGSPAGGGIFRRDAFLALGGFDPIYHPFYWEDVDLGWAAWREGWRILEDCRCHFIHQESATIRALYAPAHVARIRIRNRCLFGWKNLESPGLLARFQAVSVRRAVAHLVRTGSPALLLGIADALARAPAAIRRRRRGVRDEAAILRDSQTRLTDLLLL